MSLGLDAGGFDDLAPFRKLDERTPFGISLASGSNCSPEWFHRQGECELCAANRLCEPVSRALSLGRNGFTQQIQLSKGPQQLVPTGDG